jgi:hypothetical protein
MATKTMVVHWNEEQSSTETELLVPADHIESERRAVLFTRIAKTANERVFVLIMVSPVLVIFDAGETDRLLAHETITTQKNTTVRRFSNHAFCKNA